MVSDEEDIQSYLLIDSLKVANGSTTNSLHSPITFPVSLAAWATPSSTFSAVPLTFWPAALATFTAASFTFDAAVAKPTKF